jgi:hypothetical protein
MVKVGRDQTGAIPVYEIKQERRDLDAMVMTIHKMELFFTGKTSLE